MLDKFGFCVCVCRLVKPVTEKDLIWYRGGRSPPSSFAGTVL